MDESNPVETNAVEADAVETRAPGDDEDRVVQATLVIEADPAKIFELIADPAKQPEWDGNDNLARADEGQRVHAVGDTFVMHNASGRVRENHVVEFVEGHLIAWMPGDVGGEPFGQLWRWELTPLGPDSTQVTHTYDWTKLVDDPQKIARARSTTPDSLQASVDRLAALAER